MIRSIIKMLINHVRTFLVIIALQQLTFLYSELYIIYVVGYPIPLSIVVDDKRPFSW